MRMRFGRPEDWKAEKPEGQEAGPVNGNAV